MRVVKANRQELVCQCGSKNFEPVGKKVYRCSQCRLVVTTTKNEFANKYAGKLNDQDIDIAAVERMLQ